MIIFWALLVSLGRCLLKIIIIASSQSEDSLRESERAPVPVYGKTKQLNISRTKHIWNMVHITKNTCFHPLNPFPRWTGPTRPGPARPGPTRPDHDALWTLISRVILDFRKKCWNTMLEHVLKFFVLEFGIYICLSMAVITMFCRHIFFDFLLISLEPRGNLKLWKLHQKGHKNRIQKHV